MSILPKEIAAEKTRTPWWTRVSLRAQILGTTLLSASLSVVIACTWLVMHAAESNRQRAYVLLDEYNDQAVGLLAVWDNSIKEADVVRELGRFSTPINAITIGRDGFACILSNRGKILVGPEVAFKRALPFDSAFDLARSGAGSIVDGHGVKWLTSLSDPGRALPGGIRVVTLEPAREVRIQTLRFLWGALAVAAAVLGITGTIAGFSLSRILGPLQELKAASEKLQAGGWDSRVEIHRGDELGALAKSFNRMAEQLGDQYLMVADEVQRQIEQRASIETQLLHAQKMEAIGHLAAGIAHEINTPTQFISDNTRFLNDAFKDIARLMEQYHQLLETARRDPDLAVLIAETEAIAAAVDISYLNNEVPRAIRQSIDGLERVSRIVRAMKEFSHPGTGEKALINLNQAIESTIIVASNEWKYVAEMETRLDPALPPVRCLPGEVNQVVLNLIVNAAQAIAEDPKEKNDRKGKITLTTRSLTGRVEIRVADTGPGIPEKHRAKIFDPFFTTKPVGKGTGQGLAMAHSVIVEKHGGTICFETAEGVGTTFIIQLPLDAAAAPSIPLAT